MQHGADLFLVEPPAELSTRHERRHSAMVTVTVMVLRKVRSQTLPRCRRWLNKPTGGGSQARASRMMGRSGIGERPRGSPLPRRLMRTPCSSRLVRSHRPADTPRLPAPRRNAPDPRLPAISKARDSLPTVALPDIKAADQPHRCSSTRRVRHDRSTAGTTVSRVS